MHALLAHIIVRLATLLTREEGESDLGWLIWSLGLVILGGVVAVLGGSYISPMWREFVGRPLP